ncbi:MAG: hypothetical protein R2712_30860 [Vicinamibacterales bacterium]
MISTQLALHTRPEETPDVLQWGSIPYDASRRSFGFKATPRATRRMRERLAAGPTRVHVAVDTVFHRQPARSLIAEFPGRRWPDDRVVLVAHVQEPGANDNASAVPRWPSRSRCRRDCRRHPSCARAHAHPDLGRRDSRERCLDCGGPRARRARPRHDVARHDGRGHGPTGGTFLIEKAPDPSAVWERPPTRTRASSGLRAGARHVPE